MSLSSSLSPLPNTSLEHSIGAIRRALKNAIILSAVVIPVLYLGELRQGEAESIDQGLLANNRRIEI